MTKAKKKGLSDKVRSKKQTGGQKVNPFEVKINKQKHHVLGKSLGKSDKGMPGVSRSKAHQKRKETLLTEYKKRGKVNQFVDKRYGEGDKDMSAEDKMLHRFALEKQKTHERTGLFSLAGEDELTHYGQSLAEIEKFDDPVSSDEDEDKGYIGAKMVGEEHFGGGQLDRYKEGDPNTHKTWKERMEEMIAYQKKEKFEKKHEKELNLELTNKLDAEWKDLRPEMSLSASKEQRDKQQKDDYDIMVRELQFEMKGKPSDKMKTDEELAKEEKEKLEKLEADRMRRMKGLSVEDEKTHTHKSADDLDDGFALDKGPRFEIQYKDGKLVKVQSDDEDEDKEGSDDENGSEDSDEGSGSDDEGDEKDDGDDNEDESDESDSESGDDAMERTSDLESSGDEEEHDEVEEKKGKGVKKKKDVMTILKEKKMIMDEARKEIPYTFKAPEEYEDLLGLMEDHTEADQLVIIDRLRKCYHPSLAEGNKEILQTLFKLLVQYYGDLCVQDPPMLSLLNNLIPILYDMAQHMKEHAGHVMYDVIVDKQEEMSEVAKRRGGKAPFPQLDVLLYLKLVSLLFPTSDFRHIVVTPAMLLMSQITTQCPVTTVRDISSGLFVCTLFLEYVSFSQRFVAEAINFLNGILYMASDKDTKTIPPVIPPFKPVGRNLDMLEVKQNMKKCKLKAVKLSDVFSSTNIKYMASEDFKLHSINQCVSLLNKFAYMYSDKPAFPEIFAPSVYFLEKLPVANYPQELQDTICGCKQHIENKSTVSRRHLTMDKQKVKPLALYEPKIEDNFDPKKKDKVSKEVSEKQKLAYKYKKEMKGAIREIKKDRQFLAREKLTEQKERDSERKRKVKELIGQLASQEGDFKALKRKKDNM